MNIINFLINAKSVFFMSEAQKDLYFEHLPTAAYCTAHVLSSIFDEEFYEKINELNKKYEGKKSDKWIVLNSGSWVKGVDQSRTWCEQNKVEYEEIIAETQAQIAEIHAENRNLSEHEEMITHTVDKIARLEDERERLLMDIGKAKARALHLTRVVLAARQSYVRHTQQQQAIGRSNENSHTLINIGALQNGEQAKQYPPAAPSPRITNRNKIPKGTAEELAIWSTAHFSNTDISW